MKSYANKRGFTLIEIIFVVFLMTLLLGLGAFAGSEGHYVSDVLRTETDRIVATLRKAQMDTMFGIPGAPKSIHFEANKIVVLPENIEMPLSGVTLSVIQLAGGVSDITFNTDLGTISPSGFITVRGPRGELRRITIYASGAIDQQKL